MITSDTEALAKLKNAAAIQKQSLGLDNTEYNVGLYNGIEYSLALLEDREPHFKHYSAPRDANTPTRIESFWGLAPGTLDKE